jgi:hypothetical protein
MSMSRRVETPWWRNDPGRFARYALVAASIAASSFAAFPARADGGDASGGARPEPDVKGEIPIVAYAYTAHGATAGKVGVQAYGVGVGGRDQRATLGGGGMVWAAPIDRLTLVADGSRDVTGNFAPSAAAIVRLLGTADDGFSLGALGKFKVEGFGTGPGGETESEIEGGLLLSYAKYGWHMDLNAITGFGTGDDGEIDAEGRLRAAHDVGRFVRVGIDGQARYRMAGDKKLPGNRAGDFVVGPQVLVGSSALFGSLTGGVATMGVANQLGWTSVLAIGGAR